MNKRIIIYRDPNPENPWESWDTEPALMYEGGNFSGKEFYNVREFILDKLTDVWITLHQHELAAALDVGIDGLEREDVLWTLRNEVKNTSLEPLTETCKLLNLLHLSWTSKGYSQGDQVNVLMILTDEFFERTGCNPDDAEEILKGSQELFDNYAWRNVYGFRIEEKKEYVRIPRADYEAGICDNVEDEEDWEEIDSCNGFYGNKWMENGMSDHVPEELHEQLKNYSYEQIEETD